jgi:TolA-binding protein
VKMFKLSARFEHANQLFKQKKFLAAAREFEKMAKDHPDNAEAAKAFFNAAQGYNKAKYYDSSSRLFEKLVMDPKYKNNPFKADSLINLANNYKLFFQFGKAIIAYKAFFDRYPNSDDRAYALQEAGQLQEKNGDLRQAAKTFEKYADTFPEKKDAPAAFFAAGLLYERLRDSDEQDRIWRLYIKRFGSKLGQDGFVLRAMSKQAALAKKRGRLTKTIKKWKDIIREFERRGQAPNTPSAAAAAQAKFSLLEREFKAYAKLRLKGGLKRQRAVLAKKNKRLIELTQRYAEVFPYKRFEWTICALFRQGDLYREFAKTLYAMPEPKGEKQDVIDEWRNTVEDMGLKYENIAVSKFAITVDKSRQLNVTGRCARQALEAINKYQPEKYPLFKEEKRRFVYKSVYTVDGSAKDLQKKK